MKFCPSCGSESTAEPFCTSCGRPMPASAPTVIGPPPAAPTVVPPPPRAAEAEPAPTPVFFQTPIEPVDVSTRMRPIDPVKQQPVEASEVRIERPAGDLVWTGARVLLASILGLLLIGGGVWGVLLVIGSGDKAKSGQPAPTAGSTTGSTNGTTGASATTGTPVAAPTALMMQALRSAEVPSMCGHPAGVLVDGALPGIAEGAGAVTLNERLVAWGDLDGDGVGDAATVFDCNQGGVGWPHYVVLYAAAAAGPKLLGAYDTNAVTAGARGGVQSLVLSDRSVAIEALQAQDGDSACCASGHVAFTLRWDGSSILTRVTTPSPAPVAQRYCWDGSEAPEGGSCEVATSGAARAAFGLDGWSCVGSTLGDNHAGAVNFECGALHVAIYEGSAAREKRLRQYGLGNGGCENHDDGTVFCGPDKDGRYVRTYDGASGVLLYASSLNRSLVAGLEQLSADALLHGAD